MLPSLDCSTFRACLHAAALASAFCAASCCLANSALRLCGRNTVFQSSSLLPMWCSLVIHQTEHMSTEDQARCRQTCDMDFRFSIMRAQYIPLFALFMLQHKIKQQQLLVTLQCDEESNLDITMAEKRACQVEGAGG